MKIYPLDKTMQELEIGFVMAGDAKVIQRCKQFDRVIDDCFATWIAICNLPNNSLHPYVVWNIIARPEGFVAQSGDYCKTLGDAVEIYEKRGGE